MPTPADQNLLKVFSGPHVGAEIQLRDGEHIVGSGDDCDVILNDQLISDRHVRIVIKGARVDIEPLDESKVLIDGKPISGETALELFQYFTIGTTHLAIGPEDAIWPNHDFPEFQLQSAAGDEDELEAETPGSTEQESDEGAPQAKTAELIPTPQETSELVTKESWISAHNPMVWWSLLGLFMLFSFVGADYVIFSGDSSNEMPKSHAVTAEDVEAAIASQAPNSQLNVAQEDGFISVRGWVGHRDTKNKLEKALLRLDPNLHVNLTDSETLAASVQSAIDMYTRLESYDLRLHASAGTAGQVVVTGEAADHSVWNKVRQSIFRDVVKLKELDDTQIVMEDAQPEATTNVVVEAHGTPTTETSTPESSPHPLPTEVVRRLVSHENLTTKPEAPRLAIRSWNLGKRAMLSLENGATVFEGGHLGGGYILKSIHADQLVLLRDGKEQVVSLGEIE